MAAPQHSDVKARLRDIINDHSSAKVKAGKYQHSGDSYVDHDGDGTEGNVTYYCKGDLRQAPYELGSTKGGNVAGSVDFDNSKNVVPVTNYVPEAEDHENYTSMEAFREAIEPWALLKGELYTQIPEYHERYISQKTRDNMDSSDFAGKGTSFPIKTAADVDAALRSIGRAGSGNYSGDTIRANIKKIAKRKGYALPDSLKDSKDEAARGSFASGGVPNGVARRESSVARETLEDVRLVESAGLSPEVVFREASALNPLVKIISPGRGSSGYYTKELLERDGPQIFDRGTLMYINHATDAEEAARPEGDYNNLAAVTTARAKWMEDGPDGPALYAPSKVFAHKAEEVKEKAPYTGVSIRASGQYAESVTGLPNPKVKFDESKIAPDGKPGLIGKLTRADSIDLVTRAGRDGKLLLESESSTHEGDDMDKNEILALIKESQAPLIAENKHLREMLTANQAPQLIEKHLAGIRLPDAAKGRIVRSLASAIPMTEAGQVDETKLKVMVEGAAKDEADYLQSIGHGGNPAALGTRVEQKELLTMAEGLDTEREQVYEALADSFVGPKLDKGSVNESDRQLRKRARKSFIEGRAA